MQSLLPSSGAVRPQWSSAATRRRVACASAAEARSPAFVAVGLLAVLLLGEPAAALDLGSPDATLMLESSLQDTLVDAAESTGSMLSALGEAAGTAASDAAPVVLDGLQKAASAAAPVAAEGARVAGSLVWSGAKAAAPIIVEGAKLAAGAALEAGKAAAPYVGEGLKLAGGAALDAATAAAPYVREGLTSLGGTVVESARGAWSSAALSDVIGDWAPLCCQTNSCIQGAAACGAPPVAH